MTEKKQTIEEQKEFVDWLKSKGLYSTMDSYMTIMKMYAVWKACNKGIDVSGPGNDFEVIGQYNKS